MSGFGAALAAVLLSVNASCIAAPESTTVAGKSVIVASDGSGDFKTVQSAIDAAPTGSIKRFIIDIKAGTYREVVTIPKDKPFLMLRGESANSTIITFNKGARDIAPDGKEYGTFRTATFSADGKDFTAENLTIENAAGPKPGQAIALSVSGDRSIFRKCRILGWQDTIFANRDRQYFEDCYIDGSVDYIFGGSNVWFERCHFHSKTNGYVTAASTPFEQMFGYVFSNCTITAETGVRVELGRPWRGDASVTYLNTTMPPEVLPTGWSNWGNVANEKTARYAEYASKKSDGSPLDVSKRVPWAKQLSKQEVAQYTIVNVLGGSGQADPFGEAPMKLQKPKPAAPSTTGLLSAREVNIQGTNARLENEGDNIGAWTNKDTMLAWQANLPAGKYRVSLNYALDAAQAGSEIRVTVGDTVLPAKPVATAGWGKYQNLVLGETEIKAGLTPITVRALSQKGNSILNLRGLKLLPIVEIIPTDKAALAAKLAEIQGNNAQLENGGANIGYWNNTNTHFEWQTNLIPGLYRVALNYSLDSNSVGSEIEIKISDVPIKFKPASTGGWGNYKNREVAEFEVKSSGVIPVNLSALSKQGDFILNLREVTLTRKN